MNGLLIGGNPHVSMPSRPAIRPVHYVLAFGVFLVLATANGAGYRFGVSDQAFYIPVIQHTLDPDLFPRDAALLDAQGNLILFDQLLAGIAAATGLSLEAIFLGGYLLSLALLWTAVVLIGSSVYASPWATCALGALLTLRHRIPRTSANSLEPYFHPRMIAFGIGALAVAAVLRRRPWTAVALTMACAVVHVTTALWFAVLIGIALAIVDTRFRWLAAAGAVTAGAVLTWAATAGPLRAALVTMDEVWLQAVASKDSLFATQWPAWAWLANLALLALLWIAYRSRQRHDRATPVDGGLVWGCVALVALFLITLPVVAAGWSLLVQFQISRVFWIVEFVTAIYVIAAVADAPAGHRRAAVVMTLMLAVSAGRGFYVMQFERPDRALFERRIPDSPWEDAMRWLGRQPAGVHVLADPGHAWKYGTSVRVSAARDVLLEEVKDTALAIYSRDVAVNVVERIDAIGDFGAMDADRARGLAGRYGLDYLVIDRDLPLPLAYRNPQFRIYSLR